jgi:3-hydroxyacyl-CoA dehydrogenase
LNGSILIAGSGKMAWNIGDFFLEKDFSVHWVTSSPEMKTELLKRIAKARRRRDRYTPDQLGKFDADCHLLDERNIPHPDVIIESTHESLTKKKEVFAALADLMTDRTLIFSNSSSLLPQLLHPNCQGAHFFYPVQLTACIELIVPETCPEQRLRESLRFFREIDCDILKQNAKSAFLINRLLLPLQAACLQALKDGFPATAVDEASRSDLMGIGQLEMMDAIGLDLIHAAAGNYRDLSESAEHMDHDLLISGLGQLLRIGKKGKKNGDGLLIGRDLPWPIRKAGADEREKLRNHLANILREACLQEYNLRHITLDQLRMVCERIFHAKGFSGMFFAEAKDKNE